MKTYHDALVGELPWYPEITADKCKGCRTCFRFCRAGVLAFNRTRRKARVKYPLRCRVECRACARFCPERAISFADQTQFVNRHAKVHPKLIFCPPPESCSEPSFRRPAFRPGTPLRFSPLLSETFL